MLPNQMQNDGQEWTDPPLVKIMKKELTLAETLRTASSVSLSQAFFAGLTELDALAPFRVKDLVRRYPAARVGVENAIDDVTTTSLAPG